MSDVSPFLHREVERRPRANYLSSAEQMRARRDRIQAAMTLERLRYIRYVKAGRLTRYMQRLGDWGREHFPWIGRGWNGIGPR